jgi:hypothetical protein
MIVRSRRQALSVPFPTSVGRSLLLLRRRRPLRVIARHLALTGITGGLDRRAQGDRGCRNSAAAVLMRREK